MPELPRQSAALVRGYEIVLSVAVTARVDDEMEFHDMIGGLLEGPAFTAMQHAIEEGLKEITRRCPEEDWAASELGIDSRTLDVDEALEEAAR